MEPDNKPSQQLNLAVELSRIRFPFLGVYFHGPFTGGVYARPTFKPLHTGILNCANEPQFLLPL